MAERLKDRSGSMPSGKAGDIVKAVRALARAHPELEIKAESFGHEAERPRASVRLVEEGEKLKPGEVAVQIGPKGGADVKFVHVSDVSELPALVKAALQRS